MTAIPALQGKGGEALLTRFDETAGVAVVAVLVLAAAFLAFKERTKTPAMRFVRSPRGSFAVVEQRLVVLEVAVPALVESAHRLIRRHCCESPPVDRLEQP